MSTNQPAIEIDYPESDGRPLGETDLHRNWIVRIIDILQQRYRGQHVYVTGDLLLYYKEGDPTKYVVPDVFVVTDGEYVQLEFDASGGLVSEQFNVRLCLEATELVMYDMETGSRQLTQAETAEAEVARLRKLLDEQESP